MNCINEDKEVEKFIEYHSIIPTSDEKLLLKLAIIHGAMAYNKYLIIKHLKKDK